MAPGPTLDFSRMGMNPDHNSLCHDLLSERKKLFRDHVQSSWYTEWASKYAPLRDEILELMIHGIRQQAAEKGFEDECLLTTFFERAVYFFDLACVTTRSACMDKLKTHAVAAMHLAAISSPTMNILLFCEEGSVTLLKEAAESASLILDALDGNSRPRSFFSFAKLYRGGLYLEKPSKNAESVIRTGCRLGNGLDFFQALALHGAFDAVPDLRFQFEDSITNFTDKAFSVYDAVDHENKEVADDWANLVHLVPRDWDLVRIEPPVLAVASIEAVRIVHGLPSCLPIFEQTLGYEFPKKENFRRKEFDAAVVKCKSIVQAFRASQ